MNIDEALVTLDALRSAWALTIRSKSASARVPVRRTSGMSYSLRVAVKRKRGEPLSSMLIRLATKVRDARPPKPPHERDREIASSLGISV